MTIAVTSETDTVIKRVLPYLQRRGYSVETDLAFEAPAKRQERQSLGYVDLLVTLGKKTPAFLIEAKRAGKVLSAKDRDQAVSYGLHYKVPFVVVTNGDRIVCYNTLTRQPIRWNQSSVEKVPRRDQVATALKAFKTNNHASEVALGVDRSQPYRPGLNPKQLNALFQRCHSDIRRIEKTEDRAFQDFSKLLFLKLYEEKCDVEDVDLPYSWTFHELAEKTDHQADQVRQAVGAMVGKLVAEKDYGEVLSDGITLKNDRTYQTIVRRLASVSFYDSSFDSKGAAFEYYVRATLKGKKLGQYFTPRAVIRLMSSLVGVNKIANAALMANEIRVVDPACGTGGFLVYLMKDAIGRVQARFSNGEIVKTQYTAAVDRLKRMTFFGADANDSVASAAKMNMIIAGDGQSNIHPEDTLLRKSALWSTEAPDCDIVMTNPPFGTSEADSLTTEDLSQFPIATKRGQQLFLQKMVMCTRQDGGEVCTVIDDGVLNVDGAANLRRWLLEQCEIIAVLSLPSVTFKPNKINVRSSVLYLRRRKHADVDREENYKIKFIELDELGYDGSGNRIRGFDENALASGIAQYVHKGELGSYKTSWSAFELDSEVITDKEGYRLDLRFWHASTREAVEALRVAGQKSLKQMVVEPLRRGKSPAAELYVDEHDGYALVVKAGSNISKFGELIRSGDFIEKNGYEDVSPDAKLIDGDVLLSSTGTGTLGKCAVYRGEEFALADGHVTIIRLDQSLYSPEYVCDYLRLGFGAAQVQRLYTGSTGLIEITPEQVGSILIEVPGNVAAQKNVSDEWRKIEDDFRHAVQTAEHEFEASRSKFLRIAPVAPVLDVFEDTIVYE